MKRGTMLAAGIATLVGAGAPVHAQIVQGQATIYVPACPGSGPCTTAPTIAAAVSQAKDGDAIVLTRTGQHPSIDFQGKDITIASLWYLSGDPSHIDQTIVSGLVRFRSGEPRTATLMGFTVVGRVSFCGGSGTLDHVVVKDPPSGSAAVDMCSDALILDSEVSGSDLAGVSVYNARLELDGATVTDNAMGLHLYGGRLSVRGSLIGSNDGPGIEGYGTLADIQETEVRDNLGSGVFFHHQADLVMRNCRLIGNDSPDHGGGLRIDWASTLTLRDSFVAGNSALRDGGGIFVTNVLVARQPLIERTVVMGNDASMGGGMFLVYGSPRLRSVVVAGNSADYAAGVAANAVDGSGSASGQLLLGPPGLSLENVTVVGNRDRIAGYHAAGVADIYGSLVTVRNAILWGNGSAQGSTLDGVFDIDSSDVQGGRSGVTVFPGQGGTIRYGLDIIAADPLLVSTGQDGVLELGVPYHLSSGSPCVERGRTAPWMSTAEDVDGEARLTGERVDLGADERQRSP